MLRPINLNSPCFRFATSWVRSVPSSNFVRHDPTPAGPIQQGAVQKQNQVDEQATRSQGQSRKCLRRRGIDTLETDLNTNKRKHRTSTAMLFHLCASFIFLFKKNGTILLRNARYFRSCGSLFIVLFDFFSILFVSK